MSVLALENWILLDIYINVEKFGLYVLTWFQNSFWYVILICNKHINSHYEWKEEGFHSFGIKI